MSAANYIYSAEALYVAYFGRPADSGGLSNFSAALAQADTAGTATTAQGLAQAAANNPAITSLVNSFANSAESTALYHGSASDIVNAIYHNLFNRAPDAGGQAFWVNAINSGALSASQAALNILAGAQTSDQNIANNKIYAATMITNTIGNDASYNASFNGTAAAATVRGLLSTVTDSTAVYGTQFHIAVHAALTDVVMQNNVNASATITVPSHPSGYVMLDTSGISVNNAPVITHLEGLMPNDRFFFSGDTDGTLAYHIIALSQSQVDGVTALFGHAGSNPLADMITAAIELGDHHTLASFAYGGNTYVVNQVADHSLQGASIVEIAGVHTIAGPSGAYPAFSVW